MQNPPRTLRRMCQIMLFEDCMEQCTAVCTAEGQQIKAAKREIRRRGIRHPEACKPDRRQQIGKRTGKQNPCEAPQRNQCSSVCFEAQSGSGDPQACRLLSGQRDDKQMRAFMQDAGSGSPEQRGRGEPERKQREQCRRGEIEREGRCPRSKQTIPILRQ